MTIELYHDSEPRYLIVDELPERVTMEDLQERRYGKLMLFPPAGIIVRVMDEALLGGAQRVAIAARKETP